MQFYSFWEIAVYRLIYSPYAVFVLCLFVLCLFVVLVDFQFRFEGNTLVLITPVPIIATYFHTVMPFWQFCLFTYSMCSVFVVLCLESFGAFMMYFQNWFLSQVTGNLSRESGIL